MLQKINACATKEGRLLMFDSNFEINVFEECWLLVIYGKKEIRIKLARGMDFGSLPKKAQQKSFEIIYVIKPLESFGDLGFAIEFILLLFLFPFPFSFKMNPRDGVSMEFLCDLLLDENRPISERFRATSMCDIRDYPAALDALIKAMRDDSSLLGHVAAYELGLMQKPDAIPALKAVLGDLSLHPIVRLKAAEALGAFGFETSVPDLETSFKSDPSREVQETCELALTRIRELHNATTPKELLSFGGLEPAPSVFRHIPQLREVLLNNDKSLYERCTALFSLRLICTGQNPDKEEALSTIIESLDAESAILRHHVAYCLSQLGNKKAFHALSKVFRNASEHPLVRLKAADALRSIAANEGRGSTTYCDCIMLLEELSNDPEPIVSQSCEVALRRLDFLESGKLFFLYTWEALNTCHQERESAKKTDMA